MMMRAIAATVAVLFVSSSFASRSLLQEGISEACLNAGLAMQSACSQEIEQGSNYFGVSQDDQEALTNLASEGERIQEYLNTATPPSAGCCEAAEVFNNEGCNCDPAMLQVVSGFTGGSTALYETIVKYFAETCGFEAKAGATC